MIRVGASADLAAHCPIEIDASPKTISAAAIQ
jgi:hypothetical protein